MSQSGEGTQIELIGSCIFEKELHMISIYESMTLLKIYNELAKNWPQISPSFATIRYSAPNQKMYVTLKCDGDVYNMIRLHISMKLTIVNIRVVPKDDPTEEERQGSHIARSENERDIGSSSRQNDDLEGNSIDACGRCIDGVGQIFKDANEFRMKVKNYSIGTRRSFKYQKNDSKKIIVICTDVECKWRIYASRHEADKLFAIRKCNLQHTCCDANLRTRGHPRADSSWVANIVKDKLRGEPDYRPCNILKDIHREYGVELGYHKAWTGKEIAMSGIHGAERGSYDRLRWYCNAVKQTNPGSVADFEIFPDTQRFHRVFLCFNACIVGYVSACRPLIFLDGTHIKNKYKGCLLSAVAKDPNDDLFTLAYAVTDAENDDNWEWFCLKLRSILDYHLGTAVVRFTFFSDRHSGLIKAIPLVFPGSHHAYCLRHLVDNFKKQVLRRYPMHNKKHWASIFKKAAYAPTIQEHTRHIHSILESMPLANDFIVQSEPQCWANALFPGDRWGVINNNQAECWNNWVKPARFMPIVGMVDHIRKQIMVMMHERREDSYKLEGILCPKQKKKLTESYMASRTLKVDKSSGWMFEVIDSDRTYAVDLERWTCSCKIWQLHRIPCMHACACIESKSLSVYDFTDPYFRVQTYQQAYKGVINPIPTFDMHIYGPEEEPVINPPNVRSQPGRRRTQRIPSQVDTQRVIRCKLCGRTGHNRRTCKEATTN